MEVKEVTEFPQTPEEFLAEAEKRIKELDKAKDFGAYIADLELIAELFEEGGEEGKAREYLGLYAHELEKWGAEAESQDRLEEALAVYEKLGNQKASKRCRRLIESIE